MASEKLPQKDQAVQCMYYGCDKNHTVLADKVAYLDPTPYKKLAIWRNFEDDSPCTLPIFAWKPCEPYTGITMEEVLFGIDDIDACL